MHPAKCGEASFPGVPGLVSCVGVVGLEVQRAGQGGQCGQWQAHSHPMREPWHLWSRSWYVSVATDVLGEVVVGCVVKGEA